MNTIHYSDGSKIENPVIQIWEDNNCEASGYYRAYWCASPDAITGSPVIGYCSAGGSHRTIAAVVREAMQYANGARFFRNGKEIRYEFKPEYFRILKANE